MIESFKCDDTQKLFHDRYVKCFERVERAARRKLEMLDAASDINDLRTPPGNRLEKLSGDRKETYSIRVNQQYRICFEWQNGAAHKVEIVDYH